MLQNYQLDINEFIKFTDGGIKIAEFVQIRDAIITRYKSVYGSDIDLSTASADGVFVNDISLIINNILQSFRLMYANLDVNTASGKYLDMLCRLANISRKMATRSTVKLKVKNIGLTDTGEISGGLSFIDRSGVEWVYPKTITNIPTNGEIEIVATCSEEGQIEAPANWIISTIDMTDLIVEQTEAASVGLTEETDAELRARRAQSTGQDGITVLESLIGALLELGGIRDVKIYNNDSNSSITAQDGTEILQHDIYIILRKEDNVDIDDSEIGQLIYSKLTPGIRTTSVVGGKSYNYLADSNMIVGVTQNVYWKEASNIAPTITITLQTLPYFSISEKDEIVSSMITYLNSLPLSKDLEINDILIQATYSDPMNLNKPTYIVSNVSIENAENNTFVNPDAYYKYSTGTLSAVQSSPNLFTLTLS